MRSYASYTVVHDDYLSCCHLDFTPKFQINHILDVIKSFRIENLRISKI